MSWPGLFHPINIFQNDTVNDPTNVQRQPDTACSRETGSRKGAGGVGRVTRESFHYRADSQQTPVQVTHAEQEQEEGSGGAALPGQQLHGSENKGIWPGLAASDYSPAR